MSFVRRARRVVNQGCCGVWSAMFGLAGARRPTREPQLGDGGQVLLLAPHPDDESAGCAGTLARHREAGDPVCVAWVSDGRRSRALGLAPDEMAERRRQEATEAAARLGVDGRWLGLPEGEWPAAALAEKLCELLEELQPAVLYAPSAVDFHPEHLKVARGIADVLGDGSPAPKVVRIYPVQVPLTKAAANRALPVDESIVRQALEAYTSQYGSLERTLRMRRYAGRLHGHDGLAEELLELPPERYVALHRDLENPAATPAYRALRFDAWSDPLAYLRGASARRRWLASSP